MSLQLNECLLHYFSGMYVTMMVFCICVYDTVCTSYTLFFTSQLVEKLFVINFDLSRGFVFSPCVLRWLSVYQYTIVAKSYISCSFLSESVE